MGVYQKYRDKKGKPFGPWFVKYPFQRDLRTGKIIYKVKKASHSKTLAEKFLQRKQDEFFRRDQQGLAIEDPKPKISFNELLDWYLIQDLVKAKKSYKNDLQRAKLLKERFGNLMADSITQTQVRNFQVQRLNEKTLRNGYVKAATVNREIALIRAAYNLALDSNLVNQNPCRKIRMLKENNARDRVLARDEFERLCQALNPAVRHIVQTAYHTGMRKAEILGLTVDKVNLEKRYIDLSSADTKDHEKRRVYFGEELCQVLKECLKLREKLEVRHKYVFIRQNGLPVKSIRTAFENACKKANLKDFHFHDLRHTYNTEMRKAGVHDSVIMQQTGHSTIQMFLRYNTVDEKDGREAVRKREEYLRQECSLCAPSGHLSIEQSQLIDKKIVKPYS